MKRLALLSAVLLLVLATATSALAAHHEARVRVVHASPDAPAVDVLVNDSIKAFSNAPFKGITSYAELDPGTYNVKVVPAGATEPVVIEADLALETETDYTVVAVGKLADIEPLVLVDDNTLPAAGMAHVRFVHASPDAPNVDIYVKDGPALFINVPFKQAFPYVPVAAGTYDLEVRIHDSGAVVLEVPGLALADQTVYTVFAMGLAGGEPALTAVPSVDASPVTLPATGAPTFIYPLVLLGLGLALLAGGLTLRKRRLA
jgi:LPXTG-motif cell wall-anchored protein